MRKKLSRFFKVDIADIFSAKTVIKHIVMLKSHLDNSITLYLTETIGAGARVGHPARSSIAATAARVRSAVRIGKRGGPMRRDGLSDAAVFLACFAVAFMAAFVIGTAIAGG